MIAYRAEIWCDTDGCVSGRRKGIPHDDLSAIPRCAKNQEAILFEQGWSKVGQKHYCAKCIGKAAKNVLPR